MLREQLLGFAMKALSRIYETKERVKQNLQSEVMQNYLESLKSSAVYVVENQWEKLKAKKQIAKNDLVRVSGRSTKKTKSKKERKSSIKLANEIESMRADMIMHMLNSDASRLVKKNETMDGKTSLAYLVWALGHAERANIMDGISVHDVSALLYRACKIQLYPINISRVVYGNKALIRQVGQEKRTKTYLLTPEGQILFKEKFL